MTRRSRDPPPPLGELRPLRTGLAPPRPPLAAAGMRRESRQLRQMRVNVECGERCDGGMTMKYRMLGASGLKVSEICLGAMNFGDSTDERQGASIVGAARRAMPG